MFKLVLTYSLSPCRCVAAQSAPRLSYLAFGSARPHEAHEQEVAQVVEENEPNGPNERSAYGSRPLWPGPQPKPPAHMSDALTQACFGLKA